MKRYLDLVPIFAKIHRKQSRMSIFCTVLVVLPMIMIFGVADMLVRSQIVQTGLDSGNFHVILCYIVDKGAFLIAQHSEIKTAVRYGVLSYQGEGGYTLPGETIVIMGCDEPFVTGMMVDGIVEGNSPQTKSEIMLTQSAKARLEFRVGDTTIMDGLDDKKLSYIISGSCKDIVRTTSEDSLGAAITTKAFRAIHPAVENEALEDYDSVFYIQFENPWKARQEISDLKAGCDFSSDQIYENVKLLRMYGRSNSSQMIQICVVAAALFVLVLAADVMMIASGLNSNVAQRTEFFGLMRYIGATPRQVIRLMHKEALLWRRLVVPAGFGVGIVIIWILRAVLRILSLEHFTQILALGPSIPSIIVGTLVGFLAALLTARSPAQGTSRVLPLAAIFGNASGFQPAKKAANTHLFKVEAALDIRHAKAGRKNLVLVAGPFALSIILFLSFSVTVNLMGRPLTPLRPQTTDLSIISTDSSLPMDSEILERLKENPTVKAVYEWVFSYNLLMEGGGEPKKADLLIYEKNQFDWVREYLLEGSSDTVANQPGTALVVYGPETTVQIGDTVILNTGEKPWQLRICGMLSTAPSGNANDTALMTRSKDTFRQLVGTADYTIIDIQLTNKATGENVGDIQQVVGISYISSDERTNSNSIRGIHYSFYLFIYSSLVLIALVTVFNIVNSIIMSVSTGIRQYGASRAIGLSTRQLKKMIIAEAYVYTIADSIIDTAVGLICNKKLFEMSAVPSQGDVWMVPWMEPAVILLVVILSVVFTVRGPVQKVRDMPIVDMIGIQ